MLGTVLSGVAGYLGARKQASTSMDIAREQMQFNKVQSKEQREWASKEAATARAFNERMSSTAVQRRMEDMRKGGINPILAGKYDGSSPVSSPPSGSAASYSSTPSIPNKMRAAMESANSALQLKRTKAEISNLQATNANINANSAKVQAETDAITSQQPKKEFFEFFWKQYNKDIRNFDKAFQDWASKNRQQVDAWLDKMDQSLTDMKDDFKDYIYKKAGDLVPENWKKKGIPLYQHYKR